MLNEPNMQPIRSGHCSTARRGICSDIFFLLLCPGSALQFAIQTALSGGRAGVPKAVVMLVTDRSSDNVLKAANEALVAGKA